jgi:fumarate reductase subunit D
MINNFIISHLDPVVLLGFKSCLALITIDSLFGMLLAFMNGTFDIRLAPKAVAKNIFPYIGGMVVLLLATMLDPTFKAIFELYAGLIVLKFGVEIIKEKIYGLFKKENALESID